MYRKLPQQFENVMSQQRLLIISYENEKVTRVSEESATKRNRNVVKLADEMKFVVVTEESSLYELMS